MRNLGYQYVMFIRKATRNPKKTCLFSTRNVPTLYGSPSTDKVVMDPSNLLVHSLAREAAISYSTVVYRRRIGACAA